MSTRKFVSKGWGWEDWIVNNDMYCGKILFIKQGKKFSWHYHKLKHETFYIQEGEVELRIGPDREMYSFHNSTVKLLKGDEIVINPGIYHQAKAIRDTYIIEFSTTHYDEDSYRVVKGD